MGAGPGFVTPPARFLTSRVSRGSDRLDGGAAVLFGAPLDITETFRSGTHRAPAVVRQVSDALETYSPVLDRDLSEVALLDLGDLPLEGLTMQEALESISAAMAHAATIAGHAIMVGGEHTGSLGGYRGIKRIYPDALLIQLDAHLDIRECYEGERLSHASWVYYAGEEFGFGDIVQLGVRSGAREEWQTSRERTAWRSQELSLPAPIRARMQDRPLYLSIDIDVLDPAFAPGTGCLEPGGVSFRELAAFLYDLDGLRVVGLDIMEVSPSLDPVNATALAAAKLVREAVLLFSRPSVPSSGSSFLSAR
jgi:agmatinase